MIPKQKILIVDDEPINIKTILEILKPMIECEFFIATNGQKAIEMANKNDPDLILLDVVMPNLNGYQVCEQLKQNPHTQAIPIIFITALESDIEESKGFKVGAVDYIRKPVNPLTARARVKTHLELKRQRDLLKKASSVDGLTGLFNRAYFDQALTQEWFRAKRSRGTLALIMVDIDYFKLFNDNYGHLGGDKCLQAVANALNKAVERKTDCCCRYGGEEFVILLPETHLAGALKIAQKLQSTVAALKYPHQYSKISSYVSISIGVGCLMPQEHKDNAEILISLADTALYQAKHSGRNCIRHLLNFNHIKPNE